MNRLRDRQFFMLRANALTDVSLNSSSKQLQKLQTPGNPRSWGPLSPAAYAVPVALSPHSPQPRDVGRVDVIVLILHECGASRCDTGVLCFLTPCLTHIPVLFFLFLTLCAWYLKQVRLC